MTKETTPFVSPITSFVRGTPAQFHDCLVINAATFPLVFNRIVLREGHITTAKGLPPLPTVYVAGDLAPVQWVDLLRAMGGKELVIDSNVTLPDFLNSLSLSESKSPDNSATTKHPTQIIEIDCRDYMSVTDMFVKHHIKAGESTEQTLSLNATCTLTERPLLKTLQTLSETTQLRLIHVPDNWQAELHPLRLGAPWILGLEQPLTLTHPLVTVPLLTQSTSDDIPTHYSIRPDMPQLSTQALSLSLSRHGIIMTKSVDSFSHWFFEFVSQEKKLFGCIEGCVGRGKDEILDALCKTYGYTVVNAGKEPFQHPAVCHITASLHMTQEDIEAILRWATSKKVLLILSEVNTHPLFLSGLEQHPVRALFTINPLFQREQGQASGYKGRLVIPQAIQTTMMTYNIQDYTPKEYDQLALALKPKSVSQELAQDLAKFHIDVREISKKAKLNLSPTPRDFFNALKQLNTASFEDIKSRLYDVYLQWSAPIEITHKSLPIHISQQSKAPRRYETPIRHLDWAPPVNATRVNIKQVQPPTRNLFFSDVTQRILLNEQGKIEFRAAPCPKNIYLPQSPPIISFTIEGLSPQASLPTPIGYQVSQHTQKEEAHHVICIKSEQEDIVDQTQTGSLDHRAINTLGQTWPELENLLLSCIGKPNKESIQTLTAFVKKNLTYDITYVPGNKSDWDSLVEDRKGRCRHSAVFLIELLRMIGIDSYYIGGFQLSNSSVGRDRHAKVLAHTQEGYVEVDPTPELLQNHNLSASEPPPSPVMRPPDTWDTQDKCLTHTPHARLPHWLFRKVTHIQAMGVVGGKIDLLQMVANPLHPSQQTCVVTKTESKILVLSKDMQAYIT